MVAVLLRSQYLVAQIALAASAVAAAPAHS
jgi:hypothetical protein